jgi:hypothetical protein
MTRKYDESLAAIQEMQQAGTAVYRVEDMEFGRRLAVEKDIELPGPDGKVPGAWINAVWDESGAFVLYPTLLGIKGKAWACVQWFACETLESAELAVRSCEHGHESRRAPLWKGRERALDESEPVPGGARQEGHHHRGDGRLGQPDPGRQGCARPDVILHWPQTTAFLHVHARRARVRPISHHRLFSFSSLC